MPNFREARESMRHAVEHALGLHPSPTLDELQASANQADGAFALEMTWALHQDAPGRWNDTVPGRVEGEAVVTWTRRVQADAPLETEAQLDKDADELVRSLVYPDTRALAEITVGFRAARQVSAPTNEWRRGRAEFTFEHYYDQEAA